MTLTHFSSGVVYKEVLPQMDLECLLVGDDVKDNLILKAPPQYESFTFLYQTKGCFPVIQDQSVLFFNEKGEVPFEVTAPFMRDAKGAISEAVSYTHLHAEHVLELGGEKILGFGSDFDGCGDTFPHGITGTESMEKIVELFLRHNYSEDLVKDIFYRNAEQFLKRVL